MRVRRVAAELGDHRLEAVESGVGAEAFQEVDGEELVVEVTVEVEEVGLDAARVALVNQRVSGLNGRVFGRDLDAAVGCVLSVPDGKLLAVGAYVASPLFDEAERVELECADAMTITDPDVDADRFARLRVDYDDTLVKPTATVAGPRFLTFACPLQHRLIPLLAASP